MGDLLGEVHTKDLLEEVHIKNLVKEVHTDAQESEVTRFPRIRTEHRARAQYFRFNEESSISNYPVDGSHSYMSFAQGLPPVQDAPTSVDLG